MTDEQFDELAMEALALDAGLPRESTWARVKPARWQWLPTIPEMFVSACVCGLALFAVGLQSKRADKSPPEPNPVITMAMRHKPNSILASVTVVASAPNWMESPPTYWVQPGVKR